MKTFEPVPQTHPEAEVKNLTCPSCYWYTMGFDGRNCQNVRNVSSSTLACIEYLHPMDMQDPFMPIIQDKYIQGIRQVLKSNKFKIDPSVLDELRGYIIEDDFSSYRFGTQQEIEAIANTLKKVIQLRSRTSQLYTSMIDIKYEYDELQTHCLLWLYSKYAIIRDLKSEGMRKVIVSRIIPESIHIGKNIDRNIMTAKHVDEKLESNERTLSKILGSSEKLWFSRERVGGALKGFSYE